LQEVAFDEKQVKGLTEAMRAPMATRSIARPHPTRIARIKELEFY
jgi:hypothetical protein